MKKILFTLLSLLLVIATSIFVACDIPGSSNGGNGENSGDDGKIPQIDNSVDLGIFTPPADDDNSYIEDEKYYTSTAIDLVTEINGNYTVDRPFTLDKDNQNKRIYNNIYFYVGDFFQIIYYKDIKDLGKVYAIMSDSNDQEYAEIEYTEKGTPLQINIKAKGIYNLILDIETFAIDMVKVGDIDTPVYETIKSCELYVHLSASNFSYTEMTLNPETNEYYIEKDIPLGSSIGFYNASHTGRYKMTVEQSLIDTLVYNDFNFLENSERVYVNVGGKYKIYFNAKTYHLRLELQNPNSAEYFCQVEWNKDKVLTAVSSETPYIFTYEFVAQGKANDPYVDIPSFFPKLGMKYKLAVIDECGCVAYDQYITEDGTYTLTINLKDFSLTVEKL